MPDDPFRSAKRRVARGRDHVRNIETGFRAFVDGKHEALVKEVDAEENTIVKVKLTKPLPDELTDSAFEAIEALRSALDQAAFATAVASGKPQAKSAYFPIGDDAPGLENVIKGRCKDIPPDIVTLFRSLKPYQGGNDAIWVLNKLCAASKHKFLVPVGTTVGKLNFGNTVLTGGQTSGVKMPVPKWDTENSEMIMFVVGPDSKVDYNFSLSYSLVFGNVDKVAGCDIFSALTAMAGEVDRIVLAVEKEAQRIGLV